MATKKCRTIPHEARSSLEMLKILEWYERSPSPSDFLDIVSCAPKTIITSINNDIVLCVFILGVAQGVARIQWKISWQIRNLSSRVVTPSPFGRTISCSFCITCSCLQQVVHPITFLIHVQNCHEIGKVEAPVNEEPRAHDTSDIASTGENSRISLKSLPIPRVLVYIMTSLSPVTTGTRYWAVAMECHKSYPQCRPWHFVHLTYYALRLYLLSMTAWHAYFFPAPTLRHSLTAALSFNLWLNLCDLEITALLLTRGPGMTPYIHEARQKVEDQLRGTWYRHNAGDIFQQHKEQNAACHTG